jgi:multimeric flavodoxin WrbA
MKILALNGSYRANGNTARVLSLIEEQMRQEAERTGITLEFEKVDLGLLNIQLCRGCRACFDRGEDQCPLKDDLLLVKTKMKQADGIIAASPVYVNDVNGITKNWIDRLAHVCHRPEFAGKCAYLVATVGSGSSSHTLDTLNVALRTWGFHMVGQTGLKTGALTKRDEIWSRYPHEIRIAAVKLFNAVHERQFTQPTFISLMTFRIQQKVWQKNREDSVDTRYWKNQGWVNPERNFYIAHRAGWLKAALAHLAANILAPFVS